MNSVKVLYNGLRKILSTFCLLEIQICKTTLAYTIETAETCNWIIGFLSCYPFTGKDNHEFPGLTANT